MAKFIVIKDIAILDRGVDNIERFVAIDGVNVDDYGSLDPISLKAVKRSLSAEAVKLGATRINQSDCIDISSGGVEASDDMIVAFNGGDITYTSMQSGFAIEKFMIQQHLLLPASKFRVPRVTINNLYPCASIDDMLNTTKDIIRFLPSPITALDISNIIEMILEESRIIYFTKDEKEIVLSNMSIE